MNKEFVLGQNETREDYKVKTKTSFITVFLRKRSTRGIAAIFLVAIVAPVLVYYFTVDQKVITNESHFSCLIEESYRIPCGNAPANVDYCTGINCCFDNSTKSCFHTLPSNYYYFRKDKSLGFERSLQYSPFRHDLIKNIAITVNELDANSVQIVLHDSSISVEGNQITNKYYTYNINDNPLYVEVFRSETHQLLLTTAKGPTIISDKYWEWSFQLTDEYLFGLGQVLIDSNTTVTKVIYSNGEDHSTLPVFMAYKNGSYHGLVVHHDGPLEVSVLPSKLVSLKSLFGNRLVLEVNTGPSPQDVVKQQKKEEAKEVELWTLGVHVCREGKTTDLQNILDYYNTNKDNMKLLRYESDCLHDNLLMALRHNRDEAEQNNAVNIIIRDLLSEGRRFMLSLPPQIPQDSEIFNKTTHLDVFYKNGSSSYYNSTYYNVGVVYPNFKHANISLFTQLLMDEIKSYFNTPIENYILSNNWPLDESYQMSSSPLFQYLSKQLIDSMSLTLPWNVQSETRLQISDHNDYGALQTATFSELNPDSFVMTASHNFETPQSVIVQNVSTSWTSFANAITTILFSGVFGHPLVSIPVCGSTESFNTSVHESLCIRWYMMAATAPMFFISSTEPSRDPESLPTNTSTLKALEAVELRYQLRYYFHTLLNRGEPVMRPMFYDFPNETRLFGLKTQYMVGNYLLVAHPTLPDQTQLSVHLPEGVHSWYYFWSGEIYNFTSEAERTILFSIVETDWIIFMAGGGIIPFVFNNPNIVNLRVVLECNQHSNCMAIGSLMVEDNLFKFSSNETHLLVQRSEISEKADLTFSLQEIKVYGLDGVKKHTANVLLNEIDQIWSMAYDFHDNY